MTTFVKICGLNSEEAVGAAVEAGVQAIGFVFAPSPRRVDPARARALAAAIPADIVRVAVMKAPRAEAVREVLEVFKPDWLQTDAEDFDSFELPGGVQALPVYREGHSADRYPARLLFEGRASGSGRTADWEEAARLARRTELVLAGGLDRANVARAISRVAPWGVDVSSGVESERGRKDPARIREFVATVRELEYR